MKKSFSEMTEFMALYNRTKLKIYNFALRMVNDKMAAEDIVQNVYLRLYENMDSINKIDNVEAWLFTITRNEIYTLFRKKKVRREYNRETDFQEIEINSNINLSDQIELNDFKEHLSKELINIPEEQREVFLLKEYGEFSYKEIAQMLNIEVDLVKSRLYKVRQKLIKNLSKIVN